MPEVRMKSPRHALVALLLVLAPQLALAAADCSGGSISRMSVICKSQLKSAPC